MTKKKNIKRGNVERMKFPVLVAIMVGITVNLYDIKLTSSNPKSLEIFTEQANF